MILEDLKIETMKVVILPGKDDVGDGVPPTIKEIEQIENRYQLHSDGKAELYYSKSFSLGFKSII